MNRFQLSPSRICNRLHHNVRHEPEIHPLLAIFTLMPGGAIVTDRRTLSILTNRSQPARSPAQFCPALFASRRHSDEA